MRPTRPGQSAPPPGDEDGWNDGGVGPAASVRIASVSPDGRFVSLSFRGGASAEDGGGPPAVNTVRLHAAWLWSNDPSRVTLPSGQRTSTPGDWAASGRPAVAGAEVILCPIGEPPSSSDPGDGGTVCVPGPPPGDCCHPLAVYGEHLPWIVTRRSGPGDGGRAYLRVTWTSPSDGDGPSSTYDAEWLLRCCCPGDDGGVPRAETEVTPAHAVRRDGPPEWHGSDGASEESDGLFGDGVRLERGDDGLARIDYASVVDCGGTQDGSDGLFRLLHSVFRDGAAIVTNAPHSAGTDGEIPGVCESVASMSEADLPAGRVGRAMSGTGGLSHGALYGNVFHVRVGERGSNNVAYTSDGLCPHQDLAYYESPPGVQILHCAAVGSKVRGGESILIDAMAAAHRLREVRRGSFECLLEW
mmetsp:Transcript_774/g.1740  ORF Transcript_774/g.1740 Transcript_774/m.1740 type:complete len:414 (-) Transcript_774:659-1900(-)